MVEKIIDAIYKISTERAGIYSSLFGYEDSNKLSDYTFNFSFEKTYDVTKDVQYLFDNIIAKILTYNSQNDPIDENNIIYYGSFKHTNMFLQHGYRINQSIKLCDIENYIDDIDINQDERFVHIKWTLPIYEIFI